MADKIVTKKVREFSGIEKGEILFIDTELVQVKLTRAVKDPTTKLKEYAEKEYSEDRTRNLRDYAKEKEMTLDE